MLRVNVIGILCDQERLSLAGAPLREMSELDVLVLWDCQGEVRAIPAPILADAYRLRGCNEQLRRLGRIEMLPPERDIHWGQTVPVTATIVEQWRRLSQPDPSMPTYRRASIPID